MKRLTDKIIAAAEKQGWRADIEEQGGRTVFEFSAFTPAGQDFAFTAEMRDNEPGTLLESIFNFYQDYDPDYETYLWIGEDGHGKKGAPYHIKDILRDMEAAEDMTFRLHEALTEALETE